MRLSPPQSIEAFIKEKHSRSMSQKENTPMISEPHTTLSSNAKNKALSVSYVGDIKEYCEKHIKEIKYLIKNRVNLQASKYIFFNEQDREDAIQETLIFLWERLDQYDPSKAALSNFIVSTTNSHIFNQIRNKKRYLKRLSKVVPTDKVDSPYKSQVYHNLPQFHGVHEDIAKLLQKGLTREQIQKSLNLTPSVLNYHIKQMKELINDKRELENKCGY